MERENTANIARRDAQRDAQHEAQRRAQRGTQREARGEPTPQVPRKETAIGEADLLNISVFSDFTGISRSTLIYYDESGVFSPVARGENNYRYYSPQQIVTVNLVNVMRSLGVPLKEISRLASARSPQAIIALFKSHEQALEKQIDKLRESHKILHTLRALIESGLDADESRISVVKMDAVPISCGAMNNFSGDDRFYDTFVRYCKDARARGVNLSYPVGGLFSDIRTFMCHPSAPTRFFSIDPDGTGEKPAGRYLVGYTRGYYGQTNDLPSRLARYAESHSLDFAGPVYNIYLLDEISLPDPNEYLLQVSIPVTGGRVRAHARDRGRTPLF